MKCVVYAVERSGGAPSSISRQLPPARIAGRDRLQRHRALRGMTKAAAASCASRIRELGAPRPIDTEMLKVRTPEQNGMRFP